MQRTQTFDRFFEVTSNSNARIDYINTIMSIKYMVEKGIKGLRENKKYGII